MQPQTPELRHKLPSMDIICKSEKASQFKLLKSAIISGDGARVLEVLKQDAQLTNSERGRLLWVAVIKNQVKIASMLVEAGIDFNVRKPADELQSCFLHEFVKSNNEKYHQLAVLMMERGANVNACDACLSTPLHYTIRAKTPVDVIRELLKHGARVYSSLISEAAKHPNAAEIVALLVSGFVDDKTKSQRVDDALFYCGYTKIDESTVLPAVKLLLGMKVPVAELVMARRTFLYAIRTEKVKMVQQLIAYGFEVNGPAPGCTSPSWYDISSGELPLYAASTSGRSAITKLLIQAGAEVNARAADTEGSKGFAIHAACQNKSVKHIQVLTRHGADVNVIDTRGRTPFSLIKFVGSMSSAHRKVIRYLAISTSKGVKINDCDLKIIASYPEMHGYYMQCLDELEKMKAMKITNSVSYFYIFENARKISFLSRSASFLENLNKVEKLNRVDFPIYYLEMDFAFENVKMRKNLLSKREEAVCEALKNILPYVPLERVVYYFYLNDIK